jgi:endo-1,4-beta-mannosidase
MKIKYYALLLIQICLLGSVNAQSSKVWSAQKANSWYAQHKWISGCDYITSTAVNQLEMWQADTFDPKTIDRELGWAQSIGFNTMRVFLHSLAWKQDPAGFKNRVDQYLTIANKHHIQTIFVFFDDCWNADPKIGKQPAPKVGVHNSGWMQDPGRIINTAKGYDELRSYVVDVLHRFGHDKRILLWDMYNEPGNSDKKDASLVLLSKAFAWARYAAPQQPISAGVWDWDQTKLNAFQLKNSDVITYHDYETPDLHLKVINKLKAYGRPLICTEYMARPRNSTFENTMPMLKAEHVGAINWGLVEGKTNTKYVWDTPMPKGDEPKLWFHEVFRKDGTPYKEEEAALIKKLNGM